MTGPTVDIVCEIVRDAGSERSVAVTDGTPDLSGRSLFPRDKWFFILREEIIDCEPPLDALPASGPRMVTLTIPEWLALDRGLI